MSQFQSTFFLNSFSVLHLHYTREGAQFFNSCGKSGFVYVKYSLNLFPLFLAEMTCEKSQALQYKCVVNISSVNT